MTIALKRYKDGTYTPLMNPMVRRMDYGKKKKKGFVNRYAEMKTQMKEGTYKKNMVDKFVDRILD